MKNAKISLAYAIFLILAGLYGFIASCSKPSLYAGVGSGTIAAIGAFALLQGRKSGIYLVIATAALLLAVFCVRAFLSHGAFFPLFMVAVNGSMLFYTLFKQR